MTTIQEHIAFFLRDAQYRFAELTDKKNSLISVESKQYKEIRSLRWQIYTFMSVVYESYYDIYEDDQSGFLNDWTDDEILAEIEYIRSISGISEAPYLEFVGLSQEIIQVSQTGGSANIDASTTNNIAVYKNSTALKGKPISDTAGKLTSDITAFFAGTTNENIIEIPFVVNPAFTESQWASENPSLKKGQIGFVLNESGLVINHKVGPGFWNDLDYLSSGLYPYDETISSPIGDVPSNPYELTIPEIIRKMINPYIAPVLSNALNNAGGSYVNEKIFEIGQSISGTINVQYTIDDATKLTGATPINVTAGSIFSNEGNFANGTIGLTLASAYSPSLPVTVTISIKATHTNGQTNTISTTIKFYPRVIWGVSQNPTITATDLLNGSGLQQRQYVVTNNYKREYTFPASGYLFLAIPGMLAPSNMSFADKTNIQLTLPIEMTDMGVINNVNNGVGVYNYQLFRSKFKLTSNSTKLSVQ